MKKNIYLIILCFPLLIIAQTSNLNQTKEIREAKILNWLKDLNEKGVEINEDSIILSKEFQKILNDSKYRNSIYPPAYTWENTVLILKSNNLKLAFWYFINLYGMDDKSKTMVINSVLTYDHLFKMDKLLVNSFYTYSFMDPEIAIVKNGKPEIVHPDILEEKLANVTEIVKYVLNYREKKNKKNN